MVIGKNKVVSFDYTLKDMYGEVIDSSGSTPMVYLHGHENIIPGLKKLVYCCIAARYGLINYKSLNFHFGGKPCNRCNHLFLFGHKIIRPGNMDDLVNSVFPCQLFCRTEFFFVLGNGVGDYGNSARKRTMI